MFQEKKTRPTRPNGAISLLFTVLFSCVNNPQSKWGSKNRIVVSNPKANERNEPQVYSRSSTFFCFSRQIIDDVPMRLMTGSACVCLTANSRREKLFSLSSALEEEEQNEMRVGKRRKTRTGQ
jgi:hypothetical protein